MAVPRHFASWDEYWRLRHDSTFWIPYFRKALQLAGRSSGEIVMLGPSQYPHARAGDVVITIYPDPSIARDTFAMELEAHALVSGHGLPIPELRAHGDFPAAPYGARWNWLVESAASGLPWSQVKDGLPAVFDLGVALRRLHEISHDGGRMLRPDWQRFCELVEDELAHLGTNDPRLDGFPKPLRSALRDLAESTFHGIDTAAPTRLLHGDLHGGNVFVDPESGRLCGLIDLNEMYAGAAWYDLADACFRLLNGAPELTPQLLRGYGVVPTTRIATRLLGWALLHDFDGVTATIQHRGIPASIGDIDGLARHLTGLPHD